MALKQRIQADLKTAMLGGDRFVTDTLRNLKSAILYEEVALNKRDAGLDDSEIESVFAREIKKRTESAQLFEQGGNQASAEKERAEIEVIKQYLPEQLGEAEIREIVEKTVAKLNASGMQAMGQVMGAVRQEVGARADGSLLANIVKERLSK